MRPMYTTPGSTTPATRQRPLLPLGVSDGAVMDIMGWSNSAMVRRYSPVTARLRWDIANRLNSSLWRGNETQNETQQDD